MLHRSQISSISSCRDVPMGVRSPITMSSSIECRSRSTHLKVPFMFRGDWHIVLIIRKGVQMRLKNISFRKSASKYWFFLATNRHSPAFDQGYPALQWWWHLSYWKRTVQVCRLDSPREHQWTDPLSHPLSELSLHKKFCTPCKSISPTRRSFPLSAVPTLDTLSHLAPSWRV